MKSVESIEEFVDSKYKLYYQIINNTKSLIFYNYNVLLCSSNLKEITDVNNFIESKNYYNYDNLPNVIQQYINENYNLYELAEVIIENNIKFLKIEDKTLDLSKISYWDICKYECDIIHLFFKQNSKKNEIFYIL